MLRAHNAYSATAKERTSIILTLVSCRVCGSSGRIIETIAAVDDRTRARERPTQSITQTSYNTLHIAARERDGEIASERGEGDGVISYYRAGVNGHGGCDGIQKNRARHIVGTCHAFCVRPIRERSGPMALGGAVKAHARTPARTHHTWEPVTMMLMSVVTRRRRWQHRRDGPMIILLCRTLSTSPQDSRSLGMPRPPVGRRRIERGNSFACSCAWS